MASLRNRLREAGLPDPGPLLYTCDENWNPVPCDDVLEWGRWMEARGPRGNWVCRTEIREDVVVSTIFLGCKAPSPKWDDFELAYLFESMVFGSEPLLELLTSQTTEDLKSIVAKFVGTTDIQRRYKTVAEARVGHEELVAFVRAVLASQN